LSREGYSAAKRDPDSGSRWGKVVLSCLYGANLIDYSVQEHAFLIQLSYYFPNIAKQPSGSRNQFDCSIERVEERLK
jgi:hypothetical protein